MRQWQLIVLAALWLAVMQFTLCPVLAESLTADKFQQLHEELQPSPQAPWRTIPWRISLLDAQETAARQQKPIFIWAMDGHPLGCT